jgi:Uma2 family endonuclease
MTGMIPKTRNYYTPEEYAALEKADEARYEYWDGEIFCMSGAHPNHNRISVNVTSELRAQLKGRRCEAFGESQRVKVPAAPPYRYPDASVVCGEAIFEEILGLEALVNPVLIVEILSPTTESYDRKMKFDWYKSVPSLREYLLIAQDRTEATHYVRRADGLWAADLTTEPDGIVTLPCIDCRLSLVEVYARVTF